MIIEVDAMLVTEIEEVLSKVVNDMLDTGDEAVLVKVVDAIHETLALVPSIQKKILISFF